MGSLAATLQIVFFPHPAIGFHLEGIQVVHRSLHPPDVADAHQRAPEILHVEEQPTIMRGLSLAHVDHLMVLQRVEGGIEPVGIFLRTREDMAEDGNARKTLPAPEAAHRGLHVAHAGRPRCTEDHHQRVQPPILNPLPLFLVVVAAFLVVVVVAAFFVVVVPFVLAAL